MDSITRFVRNVLGMVLDWAGHNPEAALLVFVLFFVTLVILFAVKKSRD